MKKRIKIECDIFLNWLIIFLLRRKLGVKKLESFRFANQRSAHDMYHFGGYRLWKVEFDEKSNNKPHLREAHVSLNWLLDPECKIKKVD